MRAVCQTIMNVGGRALAWAVFLRFGFHGFLWSFAAVNMLVLLLQLWSIRRDLTLKILSFGGMIRRSRVYIGVNVLRNLTVNLDRPVVAFALGDVALADYYVAKRLFDVVRTMSRAVISPPGVKLSEAQTEGCAAVQNYFRTSMSLMTFLLIPIGFAMIGMGGPILSLVAGNNYASGSAILMCFGIAIMAQAVSQTWWHAVFRLTEAHYLFVFTALMAVVTLALYFALLPWLGPVGIPLSYASACVAASIYSTLLLRRDRNITVPLSFYGRAFACGLLVLAAIALARVLEEDFLGYVAMISAAGASYVLGFLLFAPPSLRNLAQRALRGLPMLRKTTP
jgi:O-antigen/teichoic acid export membrane protein